ncbi:MAG: hypothetical protein LUE29_01970 [Lachnospiraceae bacterium]|nr:hypothetical protein [Lachnospiraceae bacterium]
MGSKKKKKKKEPKGFLLWLVPLIMVLFLVIEVFGLHFVTKYYKEYMEARSEENQTGTAEVQSEFTVQAETVEPTTQQEETTTETTTVTATEREWDGEFVGTDNGDNTFTITWTSDFADYFEVQKYDSDRLMWETVNIIFRSGEEDDPVEEDSLTEGAEATAEEGTSSGAAGVTGTSGVGSVSEDGTFTYETPQLEPFREIRYRVLAEDTDSYAISATLICETEECAVSSIVWPVEDLDAYTTSSGNTKAGNVTTLKAYLVVEEADGRFGVAVGDDIWYIDSNYCMINLPDYIGDLCEYDIVSSYSNINRVHGYDIPGVTGTVVPGYENVSLEGNEYLVPLLYPTAQKLVAAAQSAKEQGYHLKIYDSYRGNVSTVFLYESVLAILDDPISETDNQQTYRDVMIGSSSWSLSSFLAKGRSMHNLGIAVDLTLVDDSTGKEVAMQTQIMDISHYSVTSENNDMANFLRDIMVEADFGTLSSEWWHFQDNEARDSMNLPTLTSGVSGLEE